MVGNTVIDVQGEQSSKQSRGLAINGVGRNETGAQRCIQSIMLAGEVDG